MIIDVLGASSVRKWNRIIVIIIHIRFFFSSLTDSWLMIKKGEQKLLADAHESKFEGKIGDSFIQLTKIIRPHKFFMSDDLSH